MADESQHRIHKPSLDTFVFEGESLPLLFQKKVILSVVAVFVLAVLAWIVASQAFGLSFQIDAKPFQEWIDDQGALGPVFFILIMAASVLFAPIPNVPIFIAAGLAWGPVEGSVYSMIGLTLGSAAAFFVARLAGRRHLARLIGAKAAERLDRVADTMGGRVIFWSRMLPAINFDWISFIAGLTSIRFTVFLVWSIAGMLLPTVAVVVAGDGLGHDIRLTLAMAGVWVAAIVASGVYFWDRRRRWTRRQREVANTTGELRQELGKLSR